MGGVEGKYGRIGGGGGGRGRASLNTPILTDCIHVQSSADKPCTLRKPHVQTSDVHG